MSRFPKCEREFVKGNGRNVKMFYSDSYEVRKIVKYIQIDKETAGTICRKLVQKKASIKFCK